MLIVEWLKINKLLKIKNLAMFKSIKNSTDCEKWFKNLVRFSIFK